MKGDFSRFTFDPTKHYSKVLMQQGRVQLDADWNEMVEIVQHRMAIATSDVIGRSGVPKANPGFGITVRQGLEFEDNSYVYIGDSETLSFGGTKPFTLEAWVNPRLGGVGGTIVSKLSHLEGRLVQGEYCLKLNSNGTVVFQRVEIERDQIVEALEPIAISPSETISEVREIEVRGLLLRTVTTAKSIPFGEFTHIAVTYGDAAIHLYINGHVAASSHHGRPGAAANAPFLIGAARTHHHPLHSFDGIIDEVRVWKVTQTQSQLQEMHHSLRGHATGLVSHWRFEEGTGDRTADLVGSNDGWLGEGKEKHKPSWVSTSQVWIGQGRCYVDGILCENEANLLLTEQPDAPSVTLPTHPLPSEPYLVYLDVWSRFISALEDPTIREVALGGADTAARAKTVWQVKVLPLQEAEKRVNHLQPQGQIRARRQPSDGIPENRLYRVEMHQGGEVYGVRRSMTPDMLEVDQVLFDRCQVQVKGWTAGHNWEVGQCVELFSTENGEQPGTLTQIVELKRSKHLLTLDNIPSDLANSSCLYLRAIATCKWSRENGTITFPIDSIQDCTVTLTDSGQMIDILRAGDWVELVDDDLVLQGQAAPLRQVAAIERSNPPEIQIELTQPPLLQVGQTAKHPLLRRWDQNGKETRLQGGVIPVQIGWLTLEDGIQVWFEGDGVYRSGDFWWIPARTLTQEIEWYGEPSNPQPQPPHGIQHHYASLALLWFNRHHYRVEDLRHIFTPLSSGQVSKTGDTMTGPLTIASSLSVTGDAVVDGNVTVGNLYGNLAPKMVKTHHLADFAVTSSKLSPDAGYVPLNYSILGSSTDPPPGYGYTGSFISSTNADLIWTQIETRLPIAGKVTSVVIQGKIYALWDSGEVWEFDPAVPAELGPWTRKQDLPLPRRYAFAAEVVNDKIYVVGGFNDFGDRVTRNEEYDPIFDQWSIKAPMPTPRSHLGIGAIDGRLYAIGGVKARVKRFSKDLVTAANEEYSPITDRWFKRKPLPTARCALGVGVAKGKLYAIAGQRDSLWRLLGNGKTGVNEAYSPSTDSWCRKTPMPIAKSHLGLVAVNNKIYALGGRGRQGQTAEVEVYDPVTGTWSEEARMNLSRSFHGVGLVNDRLYVLGGRSTSKEIDAIEECLLSSTFYIHQKVDM